LYVWVDKELKEIQQSIQVSRTVLTAPSTSKTVELGDEPNQLRILEYATEAWLQRVQEEREHATKALKKDKEEILEQLRVVRYCVTAYENEKDEFQAMLEEDKEKIQREKDQLLKENTTVKEFVRKELCFVPGLEQEEHEAVEVQVTKLTKAIQ